MPPWPSARGVTPGIWLWVEAEDVANVVQWWGLKGKKDELELSLLTGSASSVSFGLNVSFLLGRRLSAA